MQDKAATIELQQIAPHYDFHPFGELLRPLIQQALEQEGKSIVRKGTILIPIFVVWVVLALTLRRDLSAQAVIQWMVSATRWIDLNLTVKLISEGALSHARVALGWEVFRNIFQKSTALVKPDPDFHGLVSMIFDGTTLTMPDTEKNREEFGKHTCQHGTAGFPQLRLMVLMVGATHQVLDAAWAACRGKGTGERSLMKQILARLTSRGCLLLFDAGFYCFDLVWTIIDRQEHFIMKVSCKVKLAPIPGAILPDGSYLARLQGTVEGQKREVIVRVIECRLRGFRPFRLFTSLLDKEITAQEIARHYHQRWEVEIAFDEIKTHQCATLRGQSPTILRSKRPDLVRQELYALLVSYNTVRLLMQQAAVQGGKKATDLSFLNSLQAIIDAVPLFNWKDHPAPVSKMRDYLLRMLGLMEIECVRRGRINPRVVKVKASKFARKTKKHSGEKRDFERDLSILAPPKDYGGQAVCFGKAA